MAIIARGHTPCALCGDLLAQGDDIVVTTHFAVNAFDSFARYSDTGMHRRCFAEWPERETFVNYYNGRAAAFAQSGSMLHMDLDGRQHWQPRSSESASISAIPPRNMALRTGCHERRPGIFVTFNSGQVLGHRKQRFLCVIVAAELATAERRAALAAATRVSRLDHFRTMMTTGQHQLASKLLSHAPPDFADTPDAPGDGATFLEILGADLTGAIDPHALWLPDLPSNAVVTCWILSG